MSPRLLYGLALLLALSVAACGGSDAARTSPTPSDSAQAPDNRPLATVDSIDVPARIATNDTLAVHLTGLVGPNGCYSLARIETERTAGQIVLRPIVQPPTRDDQMCTMALVPLDTTHRVAPPFEAGTFTVRVPQEEGAAVTATVEVTDDA